MNCRVMFKAGLNPPELTDSVGSIGVSACGLSSAQEPVGAAEDDDLAREVYGVLGMPIDALDRVSVFQKIVNAIEARRQLLLSTPNVNFLIESQRDSDFRESLMHSDLCTVDGMP